MNKKLWIAGALTAAIVLAGCASTQPAGVQLDDAEIATKVKTKLTGDPDINPFNVSVAVNEGVVRLSGKVEKTEARDEAVHHAKTTEGVVRVINDIEIGKGSMGERVDDTALVVKVKAKMTATTELNPFNINVDTKDGVVTLRGTVKSEDSKDEAERLAKDTEGVRRVQNMLEVEAGS
jgi:osmotically-inducible protein OsmY